MTGYTYILASKRNGTLYVGVSDNLERRVREHTQRVFKDCFTARYHVYCLVYYEIHKNIEDAMLREKKLKQYQRKWKLELIERHNPEWLDLYSSLLEKTGSSVVAFGNPEDI